MNVRVYYYSIAEGRSHAAPVPPSDWLWGGCYVNEEGVACSGDAAPPPHCVDPDRSVDSTGSGSYRIRSSWWTNRSRCGLPRACTARTLFSRASADTDVNFFFFVFLQESPVTDCVCARACMRAGCSAGLVRVRVSEVCIAARGAGRAHHGMKCVCVWGGV